MPGKRTVKKYTTASGAKKKVVTRTKKDGSVVRKSKTKNAKGPAISGKTKMKSKTTYSSTGRVTSFKDKIKSGGSKRVEKQNKKGRVSVKKTGKFKK